jgi:hypothetical protein
LDEDGIKGRRKMQNLSCTYFRYGKQSTAITSLDGGAMPRPVLDCLRMGTEATVTAGRGGDSLV